MRVLIVLLLMALSIGNVKADAVNLICDGDFASLGCWTVVEQGVVGTNVFINDNVNPVAPSPPVDAIHGPTSLKMFGLFNAPFNQGIVLQDVPAAPGEVFDGCLEFYTSSLDAISGDNLAFFRVAFFDAAGNEIAGMNSPVCDATMVPDVWVTKCVNAFTAPAGTATVGFFIFFQNINFAGGSMFYDNATLCRQGDVPPVTPSFVPTLGQWGIFILALLFLGLGTGLFYSRKVSLA